MNFSKPTKGHSRVVSWPGKLLLPRPPHNQLFDAQLQFAAYSSGGIPVAGCCSRLTDRYAGGGQARYRSVVHQNNIDN